MSPAFCCPFQVLPEDNLLAIGKVHGDYCNLEVYVYNESDDNLYCHHDVLLPSFPLALEWLDYDPGDSHPGNLVAMGTMDPDIEIWDLDVVDTMEPAYVLKGSEKTSKKKKKKKKTSESSGTNFKLASFKVEFENINSIMICILYIWGM